MVLEVGCFATTSKGVVNVTPLLVSETNAMTSPSYEVAPEHTLARIVEIAKELISFPSVTGAELLVMEHVDRLLKRMGWHTERWQIKNDARFNVFASPSSKTPAVVLTTHLDVVPAPEALFTPVVIGDVLRGRGACDTKGIAAVMIQAAESLRREGSDDVGLLFVVGEEIDSVGAQAAVPVLREKGVRYIVNGEPTEGKLVVAQKGVFAGKIRIQGKPCHSGYPELGIDANGFLIELCHALRAIDFGAHPVFGAATLNLGMLHGGSAGNIISSSAELSFWVRSVSPAESAREPIEQAARQTALRFPGILFDLQPQVVSDPIELLPLPDFETTVFCGGSDISYYVDSGARVLMFGPGSLLNAHTNDEYIRLEELSAAFIAYRNIFCSLVS
jgi:acetylornithine deacetylase